MTAAISASRTTNLSPCMNEAEKERTLLYGLHFSHYLLYFLTIAIIFNNNYHRVENTRKPNSPVWD